MRSRGSKRRNRLALYTTIYPGVEPYLREWYHSVLAQTDHDFELWIGVDNVDVDAIKQAMGGDPKATYIVGNKGDTPAQIRQRAIAEIVTIFEGVVLVDSDDVLHPSRVAAAREALQTSDLSGCALRLVDQNGSDMGFTLNLFSGANPSDVLPRHNIFGLSNSTYRSDLLRRCLPIPSETVLVDWYLATRAWLYGARLAFDDAIRMGYRQHDANMVRVRPPFTFDQVTKDTIRVLKHFQTFLSVQESNYMPDRLATLKVVASDIEAFYRHVVLHPTRLERYVETINTMETEFIWWSCVAHPLCREMWSPRRNAV